jgi:hypothetical protein
MKKMKSEQAVLPNPCLEEEEEEEEEVNLLPCTSKLAESSSCWTLPQ